MTIEERVGRAYDTFQYSSLQHELFYKHSGFSNFGYWYPHTKDGAEAGHNLVDRLLAYLPDKQGPILDVACGQGGTTQSLMRYFAPADICAINISERQLEQAAKNAPGCRFVRMSATQLEFANESLQHIICVEAAFHFNTRQRFFEEAYRVLKPGGTLVLSDVIFKKNIITKLVYEYGKLIPRANFVSAPAYQAQLEKVGFEQIRIKDENNSTYKVYRKKVIRCGLRNYLDTKLWPGIFFDKVFIPAFMLYFYLPVLDKYLIVGARKPGR